ncbi:MAG: putative toxin-antitoxin system toxin component, PIN family [Spirochaetota bacterium]
MKAVHGQISIEKIPAPVRVVFDTNTVMALWHFRDPTLTHLSAAVGSKQFLPVIRTDCADEFKRVLAYEQFSIPPGTQAALMTSYLSCCEEIEAAPSPQDIPRCTDKDDQKFLELAIQADAGFLITRDKALLRLARHRTFRDRLIIISPEMLTP